ncbi:MAG: P-loop NTPase [Deltaproteobacteria bacterium]|nr:P-loop NTPase [Deltaproteobacteria bacterium]
MNQLNQQDQHKQQDIEISHTLNNIKNKILVMSGKGGVGKSSVAAYLSVALSKKGFKVGLMDVDLHGPSIPRMLGMRGSIQPGGSGGKARPVEISPNLHVISIEALMQQGSKDTATIWRGPLKIGVIRQFIADIEWSDLDYLIIDSPPGTGDEPLTVAQTIPDAKALIVTTPQEVSLADVRKSINFCRQVNMSILGLVENMSALTCPHCGKTIEIFKTRGGVQTAKKEGLAMLGTLPLEPEVVEQSDIGNLAFLENEELSFTKAFNGIVDEVVKRSAKEKPVAFPLADAPAQTEKIKKGDGVKVLAVPVSEGKLSSHFGHCDEFAFIETKDGRIAHSEFRTPPAHEPGVLPRWLKEQGADVAIAGGIGERAQEMLIQNNIEVVVGAPMDTPESLANQYLTGTLVAGSNICDH